MPRPGRKLRLFLRPTLQLFKTGNSSPVPSSVYRLRVVAGPLGTPYTAPPPWVVVVMKQPPLVRLVRIRNDNPLRRRLRIKGVSVQEAMPSGVTWEIRPFS